MIAALGASLPVGFTETAYSGLTSATAMALAPDGRMFVCEQAGKLRVIKNGALLTTPFVTLVVDPAGERGLIGVTVDPNFPTNQYVYVSRFRAVSQPAGRFTASGVSRCLAARRSFSSWTTCRRDEQRRCVALRRRQSSTSHRAQREQRELADADQPRQILGNSDGTIPTDNPFAS